MASSDAEDGILDRRRHGLTSREAVTNPAAHGVMVSRPGFPDVPGPGVHEPFMLGGTARRQDVDDLQPVAHRRRVEPRERRALHHPLVQLRTLAWIGPVLQDQAEGHQVKPDRLDRAPLRDAWMLHGIGVDCDLMQREVGRVAKLARQDLPKAPPRLTCPVSDRRTGLSERGSIISGCRSRQ